MEFSKHRATTSIAGLSYDSESMPTLPQELIYEILLRLPVKTLLKMRRVSKSWLCLISCHQFVRTHLKLSANNQEFAHHRILFRDLDGEKNLTFSTCSLYPTMYEEPQFIPIEFDFALKNPFGSRYRIGGSCDGLFCICRDSKGMFLWNPSTRKLKNLPSSGINGGRRSYGFGYVESQCDYRVVEIVGSNYSNCYGVNVYSLRTNSWKRIQERRPSIDFLGQGAKFINGKLHWISVDRVSSGNFSQLISSFNLVDETFGNVALPNLIDDVLYWDLGSLGGNLCSFCHRKITMDVWVMKEYGLTKSWTKVTSIPLKFYKAWPIFFSQNGEILLHYRSSLEWYNSRNKTFMRGLNMEHYEFGNNFSLYVESLVSPNFLEEE